MRPRQRPALPGPTLATTDPARWAIVQARDASAAADFVYAVKTTGIYGRPGSTARLPKRENVEFFATPQAAEAAGYRPSRRAAGQAAATRRATVIAAACRSIERAEAQPKLAALAAQAGLSPAHFHRLFKSETGLTPKAYANAARAPAARGIARRAHDHDGPLRRRLQLE